MKRLYDTVFTKSSISMLLQVKQIAMFKASKSADLEQ